MYVYTFQYSFVTPLTSMVVTLPNTTETRSLEDTVVESDRGKGNVMLFIL